MVTNIIIYFKKIFILSFFFRFINNFGVLGILDRLHGTDNIFRKSKAYQRHIFLTGLTPVSEMFPDEPKPGAAPKPALSASALLAEQMNF